MPTPPAGRTAKKGSQRVEIAMGGVPGGGEAMKFLLSRSTRTEKFKSKEKGKKNIHKVGKRSACPLISGGGKRKYLKLGC